MDFGEFLDYLRLLRELIQQLFSASHLKIGKIKARCHSTSNKGVAISAYLSSKPASRRHSALEPITKCHIRAQIQWIVFSLRRDNVHSQRFTRVEVPDLVRLDTMQG